MKNIYAAFFNTEPGYNFRVLSFFGKYLFLDVTKDPGGLCYVFYCNV